MTRKTLWMALAVLIAFIASAPFVLADPPAPQRAESALDADLAALPNWATRAPQAIQAAIFSPEDFEGAFPPTDWALYETGAGDDPGWVQTNIQAHSGSYFCLSQ